MRLIVVLMVAMMVLTIPTSLVNAQPPEIEVAPGKTVGSGYKHLKFFGEPDERGLIWNIQEPLRVGDYWAVSVLNTSDETVSGLCTTIEYHVDGNWYLSGLKNHSMWPWPYEIGPGEFSVAVGETIGHAAADWDDVRLAPCDAGESLTGEVVDLSIQNFTFNDGRIRGVVVNDTINSVTDFEIYIRCIDSDGVIYESSLLGLDIRKLDPGQTEPFDYSPRAKCESESDVIMSVLAAVRGT